MKKRIFGRKIKLLTPKIWKPLTHKCQFCYRSFMSIYWKNAHETKCKEIVKKKKQEELEFKQKMELIMGNVHASFAVSSKNDDSNSSSSEIINLTLQKNLDPIPLGMARTPAIIRTRFSKEQKNFMAQLFQQRENKSGKIVNEFEAAEMSGHACDPLEPSQIKSYWSRLSAKQKKNLLANVSTPSLPSIPTNSSSPTDNSPNRSTNQTTISNPKIPSKRRKIPECQTCHVPMKNHKCPKPKSQKLSKEPPPKRRKTNQTLQTLPK